MASKLCTLSAVPSCRYAGGRSPTHHSCLDSALCRHIPALWERSLQCCTGTGLVNSLHKQTENFVIHECFKTVGSIYTYTMWFNVKNICILLTWCIYIFCMVLTVNTDYFLQIRPLCCLIVERERESMYWIIKMGLEEVSEWGASWFTFLIKYCSED